MPASKLRRVAADGVAHAEALVIPRLAIPSQVHIREILHIEQIPRPPIFQETDHRLSGTKRT